MTVFPKILHLIEFGRETEHLSGEIDPPAAGWRRFRGKSRFFRKLAQSDVGPTLKGKRTMALALHPLEDRGSGLRERLSRALGVAGALYSLLAVITGLVAAMGLFGLFGVSVDPAAVEPARLLGLPWSLALGSSAANAPAVSLLVTAGALTVNMIILALAARLARRGVR